MSVITMMDILPLAVGEQFSGHGVTFEVIDINKGPVNCEFTTRVVGITSGPEGFYLGLLQRWVPQPDQRYWYPPGFQEGWYELHITEEGKTLYRCV